MSRPHHQLLLHGPATDETSSRQEKYHDLDLSGCLFFQDSFSQSWLGMLMREGREDVDALRDFLGLAGRSYELRSWKLPYIGH
jgi:hypothetical protein